MTRWPATWSATWGMRCTSRAGGRRWTISSWAPSADTSRTVATPLIPARSPAPVALRAARPDACPARLCPDAPAAALVPADPAGRRHLRPPAADPTGRGGSGHQVVPLPRPRPAHAGRRLPLGPGRRPRRRDPPGHRLPVPDGALLLALRRHRDTRLGRATHLAGVADVPGRRRRALPPPHPGMAEPTRRGRARTRDLVGRRDGGRRPLVRPEPLRPRLRRPHLGDPAALGGIALADRHPRPRHPA